MASTNKTPNINLSQFLGSDKLQRVDYNADMLKIDETVSNLTLDSIPDGESRKLADANKIGGKEVDISEISDGQSLVYNGTSDKFLSADVGGGAYPIIEPINGTLELQPFVQYEFGEVEELTLSFAPPKAGYSARYIFTFTSGILPTVVNIPANVKWNTELSPLSNKTYIVTVDAVQVGYIAVFCEADRIPSKSALITTWNMPAGEVSIPSQEGTFDCVVDWGDGTAPTTHTTGSLTHTYAESGQYQIVIEGQYNGFSLEDSDARSYLTTINQWGDVGFSSISGAFNGCSNLTDISSPITGAESLTNFSRIFASCAALTSLPERLFSACKAAVDLSYCFAGCSSLVSLPSDLFSECRDVQSFGSCFVQCSSLIEVPEGLFNASINATTFKTCFNACSALTTIPLSLFDNCSNATEFIACFNGCTSLSGKAPELWITHQTAAGYSCFLGCTGLSNYASIPSNWR